MPERAEAAAFGVGNACLLCNFRKGAVSIVAKQQIPFWFIRSWIESKRNLQSKLLGTSGLYLLSWFVPDVAADVKIKIPVPVVVTPGNAGPEALGRGKTLILHQMAVIVAKQNDSVVAGDYQVEPAIIVVVSPGGAHAVDAEIRKILHLLEPPVSQVMVEHGGSKLRLR